MSEQRIVSFLPSATEMIYALGLGDRLVGRSHECDYPPEVRSKPKLVDCVLDLSKLTMAEIDAAVTKRIASGQSLYSVDEAKLRAAAPDLLVTQNLCQVCGPSGNEVSQVLKSISPAPKILWQTPRTIAEVYECLMELGRETGTSPRAEAIVADYRRRRKAVAERVPRGRPRRVSFFEWVDPVYGGGHWVPEMLSILNAEDPNSRMGKDSVRISWADVLKHDPETAIVAPCGFNLEKAVEQAGIIRRREDWENTAAFKRGAVFAADANSYYARPGPRIIDGLELMAHMIYPDVFKWTGADDAFKRLTGG